LEFHLLAEIFPVVAEHLLEALGKDVAARGLLEEIVLCDSKILDGRCRYLACQRAGVAPKFREYVGDDPLGFVISQNVHRRHLTTVQRVIAAARAATLPVGVNQTSQGLPIGKAAKIFQVSERHIARAKAILRHGAVELIKAVESGTVALSHAAELCQLPHEAQITALRDLGEHKRHPRQKKKPAGVAKEETTTQVDDDLPLPGSSPGGGGYDTANLTLEDELACARLMSEWLRARNPARIKFLGELMERWS
jgi:hypothetical protein